VIGWLMSLGRRPRAGCGGTGHNGWRRCMTVVQWSPPVDPPPRHTVAAFAHRREFHMGGMQTVIRLGQPKVTPDLTCQRDADEFSF